MLKRRLINLTKTDIDILTNKWVSTVLSLPITASYKKVSKESLILDSRKIYEELETWLDPDNKAQNEIENYYTEVGKKTQQQGFKLEEVVMGILLSKKILWEHVLSKGLPTTAFELYAAIDLNNYVIKYFDKAVYYTIKGYQSADRLS